MSKNLKRKNKELASDSRKRFNGSLASLETESTNIPRPVKRSNSQNLIRSERPSKVLDSIIHGKCTLTPIINVSNTKKLLKTSQVFRMHVRDHESRSQSDLAKIFSKISKLPDSKIKLAETSSEIFLSRNLEKQFDEDLELVEYDDASTEDLFQTPYAKSNRDSICCTPLNSIKVPKTCKRQKKSKHKSKIEQELSIN